MSNPDDPLRIEGDKKEFFLDGDIIEKYPFLKEAQKNMGEDVRSKISAICANTETAQRFYKKRYLTYRYHVSLVLDLIKEIERTEHKAIVAPVIDDAKKILITIGGIIEYKDTFSPMEDDIKKILSGIPGGGTKNN